MNWVLIIVVIFLIICAFTGYHMGLIKKLFSIFSFIVSIIAATAMMPYVSDFIKENTPIYDTIEEGCKDIFSNIYDNEDGNKDSKLKNEDKGEDKDASDAVPNIIKEMLLGDEMGEVIAEEISEYFSSQVAQIIVNSISFFLAFAIIQIVLRTTVFTLDIITNLPIIKGLNQYAGLALGICEGIVWVWIFFLIVMLISTSETGRLINGYIKESEFLSYLYNNNYLYKMFT